MFAHHLRGVQGCGVNETLMMRAIAAIHATGLQNVGAEVAGKAG
jgi:hypothetical protein